MSAVAVVAHDPLACAASPCINVCRMDKASGWCEGCRRTIDEIAAWSRASNDERLRILAAVERRGVELPRSP